jgi:uncharacterized protein YuzE
VFERSADRENSPGCRCFESSGGPVEWSYDAEADTLYVSFGAPRPAVGIDIGEGMIVRYDETTRKVVGVTIVGIGGRVEEGLGEGRRSGAAS